MSAPVPAFTCSSTMWPSEAGPDVAQRTAPGLALAASISALKSLAASAEVPSSSTGEAMTLTTGTMSLTGSNGDLPRCGLSTSGLMAAKPRLWPSGAALATASMPMLPLAPALLSTTTLWPSTGARRSASRRATLSATPPGG